MSGNGEQGVPIGNRTRDDVADLDYTFGYYSELNPNRIALTFLRAGLAPPEVKTACELGFGQGVSINIHAGASDTRWYGTDFNPAHTVFAQSLATASGAEIRLFDQSFAAFCSRADLPEFDFIGLHGVWSWISEDNQRTIVELLRRKLKTGGVVYIGYNTLPGLAAMVPFRHLLSQHAETMANSGHGLVARIDAAFDFADRLFALNPAFLRAHPIIPARFRKMKEKDRHYLAHEYFTRDWRPMLFAEMAEWLAPAQLTYACSASYLDHIDALNLTADQRQLLAGIPDARFREAVRDFIINQSFRRDFWVKGARRLSTSELAEAIRRQRVVLTTARCDIELKVTGPRGQGHLSARVHGPILDALQSGQPRSLGEIEQAVEEAGLNLAAVFDAVIVVVSQRNAAPVQDEAVQQRARPRTEKLNRHILEKVGGGAALAFLASPVTGGAVPVSHVHQLLLRARAQGLQTPGEWAEAASRILRSQAKGVTKDGKPVPAAETVAELTVEANTFVERQLPVLRALQVA